MVLCLINNFAINKTEVSLSFERKNIYGRLSFYKTLAYYWQATIIYLSMDIQNASMHVHSYATIVCLLLVVICSKLSLCFRYQPKVKQEEEDSNENISMEKRDSVYSSDTTTTKDS